MRTVWLIGLPLLLAGCNTVDVGTSTFHFVDMRERHGHWRGEAVEEAAAGTCDTQVGVQTNHISKLYKACMRRHGWKYTYASAPPPQSDDDDVTPEDDTPVHDSAADVAALQQTIDASNEQAAADAQTAASEAQLEAGAAGFQ